jgi:hypothetical protein
MYISQLSKASSVTSEDEEDSSERADIVSNNMEKPRTRMSKAEREVKRQNTLEDILRKERQSFKLNNEDILVQDIYKDTTKHWKEIRDERRNVDLLKLGNTVPLFNIYQTSQELFWNENAKPS